ncbi:MAG: sulfatase [Cyclobacteriaceae bacterium]
MTKLILQILFFYLIPGVAFAFQQENDQPNVLFFLADDLGWRDLSCQGSTYYRTPHIDQLAKQGVRFTQAYAASAVCSPTRSSILTGQAPARTHITDWIPGGLFRPEDALLKEPDWQKFIEPQAVTLPELFTQAGYRSIHIGKWHLGNEDNHSEPQDHGYETDIASLGKRPLGGGAPKTYFSPYGFPDQISDGPEGEYLPERLANEAVAVIQSTDERPFFLMLSHYLVHTPIQAKEEMVEKWKAIPANDSQNNPVYAAMVESLDNSFGKVMAALEASGKLENTIIVFCSDNGGLEETGPYRGTSNDPLRGQKGQYYEGGIRIPMIIKWPGVTNAGTAVTMPVLTTDLFPTLAGILDTALPENLDGLNLKELLTGGMLPDRNLYWHYPHYHKSLGGVRPSSTIRQGNWKLIEHLETGRLELYNLSEDPHESQNLAEKEKQRARQMQAQLATWRKNVGAQMPEKMK